MRPKVEYKREAESKSGASRVTHRRAAINECKSSQFNLFYSWFDGLPSRNACCALISVLPRTTSTDAPVSMTPLCLHLLRGCSSTTIFCLLHTTTPTPLQLQHPLHLTICPRHSQLTKQGHSSETASRERSRPRW